jgi:hypothetical protein
VRLGVGSWTTEDSLLDGANDNRNGEFLNHALQGWPLGGKVHHWRSPGPLTLRRYLVGTGGSKRCLMGISPRCGSICETSMRKRLEIQ